MADIGQIEDDFEVAHEGSATDVASQADASKRSIDTTAQPPTVGPMISPATELEEIPLASPDTEVEDVDSAARALQQTDHGATLSAAPLDAENDILFSASYHLDHGIQEPAPQDPPKRKLFGWLSSRSGSNSSVDKTPKSPPPQLPHRASGFLGSTSSTRVEEDEAANTIKRLNRISLKDQFKLVRLREEAGIVSVDQAISSRPGSPVAGGDITKQGSGLIRARSDVTGRQRNSSGAASHPTVNFLLPPGTAAGTVAGPDDSVEPVDWDLWQEVVYDGPAAVARTSASELNRATMRGIPSAIRGVVWQVLANSKNEELESVYRELVNRGKPSIRKLNDLKPRANHVSRAATELESITADKTQGATMSGRSSIRSDVEGNGSSPPVSAGFEIAAIPPESNSLDVGVPERSLSISEEKSLVAEQNSNLQKLERAIRRDLGARTSYSKFVMSAGLQEGLFGICKAYALFDEEVGYAQGMNFIAMPLLFNMTEEEAFCLFVRLMNNYNLRDLFIQDMPGLHVHLYQFDRLLEDLEPAVYCHLHRRGVTPHLYATQWFLTLFAYRFPLQLVLRIYDLILSEGLESAILKLGIVLVRKNKEALLRMQDMAALTTFLKEQIFDYYIDKTPSASSVLESGFFGSAGGIDKEVYRADALVRDACEINVTPEMLRTYTSEWNVKLQDEKERAAAEEALKLANATLTIQVRQLTERCDAADTEHVQMASEIVRIKVEDQRLSDENESLTTRVRELEEIVKAQPGEVEDKLRHEMDRIMQRNIEVQNENRALEESTAEMETELVNAKMQHAEISSELDAMRRKWSSVTAMMSGIGSPAT